MTPSSYAKDSTSSVLPSALIPSKICSGSSIPLVSIQVHEACRKHFRVLNQKLLVPIYYIVNRAQSGRFLPDSTLLLGTVQRVYIGVCHSFPVTRIFALPNFILSLLHSITSHHQLYCNSMSYFNSSVLIGTLSYIISHGAPMLHFPIYFTL